MCFILLSLFHRKNVDDFTGPRERSDLGFITFDLSADILKNIANRNELCCSLQYMAEEERNPIQRQFCLQKCLSLCSSVILRLYSGGVVLTRSLCDENHTQQLCILQGNVSFLVFPQLFPHLQPIFDWNVKQLFLYLSAEYATKSNVSHSTHTQTGFGSVGNS